MEIEFEWDARKAAANIRRHGVAFEEATSVFADPLARIFDDPDHSVDERREIIVGYSSRPRLLVVGFADRSGRVRVIPARRATRSRNAMKKTRKDTVASRVAEPRAEYTFDYARGRKNRFATKTSRRTVAIVLAPDVAQVFDTSRSVNRALRAVIKAVPDRETTDKRRRKAG
jgi:uncharacterized DUF497 family protein